MDISLNTILLHEIAKDVGIRSCNFLAIKPLQTRIINFLRDSQTQTTFAKTKTINNLGIFTSFHKFILANDTDVSDAACYTLRNIIITEIQNLEREVRRLHQKSALRSTHFNVCF